LTVDEPAVNAAADHPELTAVTVRLVDVEGNPMPAISSLTPAVGVCGPAVHAVSDVASLTPVPVEATVMSEPVISNNRMESSWVDENVTVIVVSDVVASRHSHHSIVPELDTPSRPIEVHVPVADDTVGAGAVPDRVIVSRTRRCPTTVPEMVCACVVAVAR
jgi:hypothetical protein